MAKFVLNPSGLAVPAEPPKPSQAELDRTLGEILSCERWDDIGYAAIAFDAGEHAVDFKLYDTADFDKGIHVDKARIKPVDEDDWDYVAEGSICCDGCSNWNFQCFHACSRQQLESLGSALSRCWEMAENLIQNFIGHEEDHRLEIAHQLGHPAQKPIRR